MVKVKYAIIGTMILIAGIFIFIYFFQSEDKKVRKRFDQLSEWSSKDQGEDHFTMAGKIKNIGESCAEDFMLIIPEKSIVRKYSPKEIPGLAARLRLPFITLTVKFNDIQIEFTKKKKAKAVATVIFSGSRKEGEPAEDIFEVECSLIKPENKWLFSSAEIVEVLEK
jgi:hypothetical protein